MVNSTPKSSSPAVLALLWALLLAALHSCIGGESSEYRTFSPGGWAYTDSVVLLPLDSAALASADSAARFVPANVAVAVRHSNGYEYSNLWVELTYHLPGDDDSHRDTFNLILADDLGNWQGTGLGVDYQLVDTVMRHASLDLGRPLSLRHIMRADTLPALQQAGIIIITPKE